MRRIVNGLDISSYVSGMDVIVRHLLWKSDVGYHRRRVCIHFVPLRCQGIVEAIVFRKEIEREDIKNKQSETPPVRS
jgi:hypothetical protein